jgi:hypothetical protein
MSCGGVNDEQHILTFSNGCFQWIAFVRERELPRLSGLGSPVSSEGFSHQFEFDVTVAIILASISWSIGDRWQGLQHLDADV